MPDRDAFIRAIIENPDDDAPRLIYADWLDERGDAARAEFIRVQCQLCDTTLAAEERMRLERRERSLLRKHRGQWQAEVGVPLLGLGAFYRGFLDAVGMNGWEALEHGET